MSGEQALFSPVAAFMPSGEEDSRVTQISDTMLATLPEPNTRARRATGVLRVLAGLVILAGIITQIVDESLNDAFFPGEYFAYFTIQSSMMNVVVLLVGGWLALRVRRDSALMTQVSLSIVAYAVVTGAVYNLLLRDIPSVGYVGIAWPNEVMHVWIPILITLDWLFAPGRPAIAWRHLSLALIYPLAWVSFTLVRGPLAGWYPYPFLNPTGPAGTLGVVIYVVGIAAFIIAIAAVAIVTNRFRAARRPAQVLAEQVLAEQQRG
jgi:hypothetical protein